MENAMNRRFDQSWFSRYLKEEVVQIEWSDVSVLGLVSGVKKVKATLKSGETLNLVLKLLLINSNGEGEAGGSGDAAADSAAADSAAADSAAAAVDIKTVITVGCAREADFYNAIQKHLSKEKREIIQGFLPKVYHASSNWSTGEKIIVMEDLSEKGIVSGLYFGDATPLNWGKDLVQLTSNCPDVNPVEITHETFLCVARLHASFWNSQDFSEARWVRGNKWMKGEGAEEWETSMKWARDGFDPMEQGDISDGLWHCLRSFYKNLHWDNFMKEIRVKNLPWTFIHGDFHPGNIMWMPEDPTCKVRLYDWEMVGVGFGPQELGQYVISHLDLTKYGADVQKELVKAYYDELVAVNPSVEDTMSFGACFDNFVYGGLRNWLWMLPSMVNWPGGFMPFFAGKMDAFRRIHGVSPDKIGYPDL